MSKTEESSHDILTTARGIWPQKSPQSVKQTVK